MKRKLILGFTAALTAFCTLSMTACDFLFGNTDVPPSGAVDGDDNAVIGQHTHSYSKETHSADCLYGGYVLNTCACGDSFRSDETDPLGHNYVNYVCTRCKEVDPNAPADDGFVYSLNGDSQSYSVVKATDKIKELANVEIPNSHENLPVTAIAVNVFSNFTNLETVKFPAGLKTIYENAFSGCVNLKNVSFPNALEEIRGGAFFNCDGITEAVIPASVKELGRDSTSYNGRTAVFGGCDSLVKLSAESGNTVYTSQGNCIIKGNTVVQGCTASVIPDDGHITKLGDCSFAYFTNLTTLRIPDSVTKISYGAFEQSAVSEIELPANLLELGASAFKCCSDLTHIEIPDGVEVIEDETFAECFNLIYVDLNNVYRVGMYSFRGCALSGDSERRVDLSKLGLIAPFAFADTRLYEVYLPNINFIGDRAFEASGISRAVFGPELREIREFAFFGCYLNTVEFIELQPWQNPEDFPLYIGDGAFKGCRMLRNLTIPARTVYIGAESFDEFASYYENMQDLPEEEKPSVTFEDLNGWNLVFRKNNADDFGYYRLADTELISNPLNNAQYYMHKDYLLNRLKELLDFEGIEYFDFDSFCLTKTVSDTIAPIA